MCIGYSYRVLDTHTTYWILLLCISYNTNWILIPRIRYSHHVLDTHISYRQLIQRIGYSYHVLDTLTTYCTYEVDCSVVNTRTAMVVKNAYPCTMLDSFWYWRNIKKTIHVSDALSWEENKKTVDCLYLISLIVP